MNAHTIVKHLLEALPEGLEFQHRYEWHECGDEADSGEDNMLIVWAIPKGGSLRDAVGRAEFVFKDRRLLGNNVEVNQNYRRCGIATALYVYAEKETGLKAVPHSVQTPEGRSFWNQPDRPFGK